jgi:hypothetical protein
MARLTREQRLGNVHESALNEFDRCQTAMRDERLQCLQDRRFYSLAGAQWEGPIGEQFENKPRFEVNKVHLSVIRIINEYRNNRISVDFVSKDGSNNDKLAETCNGLYRADEQDSVADEAFDNAFEEGVGGGFGAWRLRTVYEDDEDDENEKQRIRFEPIYDADSSVFFDLDAKRQDKSDAKYCFVLYSMTREAYMAEWQDDPATWPKLIQQIEFDWDTPDVVYVAEYYRVEEVRETVRIFQTIDGEEERYTQADFDADESLEETLLAVGTVEVRQKRVKRRKVHKYIMSGGGILDDMGYIAGKNIPIVPYYGKRWFVDNVERCMGHVRLAKDPQRLKNMQLSKLGEISALSSIEKPILVPEQVIGHQAMWAEDNIRNYPYLLVNPITGANGEMQAAGPVAYTKSSDIPPAMAALLQLTEQDMAEILGNNQQADKMVSNISGKAVEMIQTRLDMQSFIYMTNMAKAMRRCGEIWLSMAKDIYVEERRKMKQIDQMDQVGTVELMKPIINAETGELDYENDLSKAAFDVAVDVGPSFTSRREATVRALTGMMQVTSDPETQMILQSMAIMNMDGEGISDIKDFFRTKLVQLGVVKPTEEEQQQMMEAMMAEQANQQPDPQTTYLLAEAQKSEALARKALADTELTMANAEKAKADTLSILSEIDNPTKNTRTEVKVEEVDPIKQERERLDIESKRFDLAIKMRQLEEIESKVDTVKAQITAAQSLSEASQNITSAVSGIDSGVAGFKEAVEIMTKNQKEAAQAAIKAVNRPKKLIREKGKIVGIE